MTIDLEALLLGIAIGDAFGAGVEFQDRTWIKENVHFDRFINARPNINVSPEKLEAFTKNYVPWDYTDDTEMTVGTIKALITNEPLTTDLLIKKWTEEYKAGENSKGFGRNGHGSMRWYYDGEMTIDQIRDFQRDRPNPSNAPAMRTIPFGLLPPDKIEAYAVLNAYATHPNEIAALSSLTIARAAEFILVKQGEQSEVINYCLDTINLNTEYATYFSAINTIAETDVFTEENLALICGKQPIEPPYFLPGIKGLPSDSKLTASAVLVILKYAKSPFDALKKSILLGGDVDSAASITTGIMAGKHGLADLPDFMLENVEGRSYLQNIAQAFSTFLKNNPVSN